MFQVYDIKHKGPTWDYKEPGITYKLEVVS